MNAIPTNDSSDDRCADVNPVETHGNMIKFYIYTYTKIIIELGFFFCPLRNISLMFSLHNPHVEYMLCQRPKGPNSHVIQLKSWFGQKLMWNVHILNAFNLSR